MVLKGELGTIEINVIRRSSTNTDDYWDANWLESEIKVNVPGFKVSYGISLRVEDLQTFYDALVNLTAFTANKAEFKTMEEGLYLKCIANSRGQVVCSGRAKNQPNILEFELQTDIISVNNFASELKSTLELFPLIGKEE